MNILVTGAKGMVGTALVNNLKNVRDGKNRTRANVIVDDIFEYDIDSSPEDLDKYCRNCDCYKSRSRKRHFCSSHKVKRFFNII